MSRPPTPQINAPTAMECCQGMPEFPSHADRRRAIRSRGTPRTSWVSSLFSFEGVRRELVCRSHLPLAHQFALLLPSAMRALQRTLTIVVQAVARGWNPCGAALQRAAEPRAVNLYDFEPITTFTLTASAHSTDTRAPRYSIHRLNSGRLSGGFWNTIRLSQWSLQPRGATGRVVYA